MTASHVAHDETTLPWARRTFVIAEAGVNHNGDVELAKKLIDSANAAKADAVKFQTWKPGELTGKFTDKVGYQRETTDAAESRYELSKRLALPFEAFRELQSYADKRGILFLSTPDGFESLDFLVDELNVPIIKVGSSEVTHIPFLEAVGAKGRPVILSTGLSTLGEVETAVAAVRRKSDVPLAVLHCTSEYPAPLEEINLRAMTTMGNALGLPVGLSDHSTGMEAAIAAVTLGACVIEKHFTGDKSLPGPDHRASLEPGELRAFVEAIRNTEVLLGDGVKRATPSEACNRDGIRRSIVAVGAIAKGTVLTRDMMTCKRPGYGIAPDLIDRIVGMTVTAGLEGDQPIEWKHLK